MVLTKSPRQQANMAKASCTAGIASNSQKLTLWPKCHQERKKEKMGRQLFLQLPTDDTDVLQTAGSSLRRAPDNGRYDIWYGSDQADGQLEITRNGEKVLEASEMPVITANALKIEGQPHVQFWVKRGHDVIINYNEVTGGTASMHIKFKDAIDLAMEGISVAQLAALFGQVQ